LKIKVINNNGAETTIDSGSVLVGGLTLTDVLKRLVALENKVQSLTANLVKKEAKLQQMVKKL
jgi:hypothetical protein